MPRITRLAKNTVLLRSLEWARAVHDYPVRFNKANGRDPAQGLYLPEADAFLTERTRAGMVLLEDLPAVERARKELGAKYEFVDGGWQASFDGLRFRLVNKEDAWLLTEIFLEGTYHFASKTPPSLAIDIGMNCGFAAIYMARQFGCEVHAFELCGPTFEAAEANMALNPDIARRIHRNCFGLSDQSGPLEIDYPESHTVVASMYDLGLDNPTRKLAVEVRRASEVLGPVLEGQSAGPVYAKIDCEGAEFPILRDLDAAGLLPKLDAVVMEWHSAAGDPQELIDTLARNGFHVFNQHWVDELGFLRASRR